MLLAFLVNGFVRSLAYVERCNSSYQEPRWHATGYASRHSRRSLPLLPPPLPTLPTTVFQSR